MNEDSRAADAAYFSDLTDGADFFLLRHGESEGNARLIIQGTLDLPLTGRGEAQAAAAGEWLATKGVIRILTSPLSRALRTAQIIADRARLPAPEPDPVFTELDTGAFTGLDMDGIRERHPEAYAEFLWRSWDAVPGAEGSAALYGRSLRGWDRLKAAAREAGGAVVLVSHGGCIQWLVRSTFGCRTWMPLLTTGNCAVFHLEVRCPVPGKDARIQWRLLDGGPRLDGCSVPPMF